MLIKIDIKSDLYRDIEELINEGKYEDIYQFVSIALKNQILEEQSGLEKNEQILEKQSSPSIRQHIQDDIWKIENELRRWIGDIPLDKNEIQPPKQELIWNFYNRFFPIKIVVRQLVGMIQEEKKWIELSELQEQAFNYAHDISADLKDYEEEYKLPRNKKLSTGLPTPKSELKGYKGSQRRKKEAKMIASKLRFMEQFVGKQIKKEPPSFKGACFELGLIRVKFEGEDCLVTLSEVGNDFALMENPILDNEKYEYPFSNTEADFILEKIIPKFELENTIIKKILNELQKNELTSKQIDTIFKEEKLRFYSKNQELSNEKKDELLHTITQERVSTMGRLSELKLVNWEIDKEGRSVYSAIN